MKRAIFITVLLVFGLTLLSVCASIAGETTGEYLDDATITINVNTIIIKDPDAHYLDINVTTTQGDVVLQGFVNNGETEARLVAKVKEIKGVKSVRSLLKVEERK